MANALTQNPLFIDTDMTTAYWETTGVLQGQGSLFITKILMTCPGGTVTAGTVTVSDGATTPINLLKVPVTTANTTPQLFDFTVPLTWRDFKITGLTATGIALQIWTR